MEASIKKAKGLEGLLFLLVITSVLTKAQLLRAAKSSLFSVMGLPMAQSPGKKERVVEKGWLRKGSLSKKTHLFQVEETSC